MAKQRSRHSLVAHENLAHLLPSTKLMIIARENSHIHHNHATKQSDSADACTCGGYPCSTLSCSSPSHVLQVVTINQISLTTRVSGCSPYLESLPSYTDGAPPWAPTNRGHGITSRPLKHDPRGETCSLRRASPSPRREHKSKGMSNARSRLSEIPLAWASCLLAQKLSESPGRPFVQKPRRAPCFISPRRDGLAWARLTGLAIVLHCNSHENRTKPAYKAFSNTKSKD
ncbi:hypothetical protein DEO72_LG8g1776 [Vigna unguiculata]|uniref:Uncharacterized protein n=1 Tax=Vigna unguiculata TaxID=3917 RepID=A0A4D6MQC2_VIGUN|nr:hypothetical protein DEO72_LG8g1776 [Vigna unguiculata]